MEMTHFTQTTQREFNQKLPRASLLALIGSSVAVLGAIASFVLTFIINDVYTKTNAVKSIMSTTGIKGIIIYSVLGVLITCVFCGLSLLVKSRASKVLGVNFIVFSAIAFVIWLFGMVMPAVVDLYLSAARTNSFEYTLNGDIDVAYDSVRNIASFLVIPGIISLIGWVLVFISGIIQVTVDPREFAKNKKQTF